MWNPLKLFRRHNPDPDAEHRQKRVDITLEATTEATLRLKELAAERDSYRRWPQQRNRRERLNAG